MIHHVGRIHPSGQAAAQHRPEIINHERRPSKPKQTELWVLLAVVAVAFYSHFEPKLLSILDRFADPKPGVIDAVAALREAGLKIGSTTGYTDAMMEIVVPKAAELGYAPDHWVSADGTEGFGRPNPYMIFHNMQVLRLMDVRRVAKVGDTISDIKEGKNAGGFTVGVTEGSSQMGLSLAEFEALSPAEQDRERLMAREAFLAAGADAVIDTMAELPALLLG